MDMDIKSHILKLKKTLNQHNLNYYVNDNPEISDSEYDLLLKELELLESGRKILNEDYKESSKDLKKLTQNLDKATKKVKKLESQVSAKVTRLSELEGAAANNSEAVTTQRDELESLRKDAGELEMQKHRLEGEKEQLEIQLINSLEKILKMQDLIHLNNILLNKIKIFIQEKIPIPGKVIIILKETSILIFLKPHLYLNRSIIH